MVAEYTHQDQSNLSPMNHVVVPASKANTKIISEGVSTELDSILQ